MIYLPGTAFGAAFGTAFGATLGCWLFGASVLPALSWMIIVLVSSLGLLSALANAAPAIPPAPAANAVPNNELPPPELPDCGWP